MYHPCVLINTDKLCLKTFSLLVVECHCFCFKMSRQKKVTICQLFSIIDNDKDVSVLWQFVLCNLEKHISLDRKISIHPNASYLPLISNRLVFNPHYAISVHTVFAFLHLCVSIVMLKSYFVGTDISSAMFPLTIIFRR